MDNIIHQFTANVDEYEALIELLLNPSVLLLGGLLLLYGLIYLFQDGFGKGDKLANGRFAGHKERESARFNCLEQMIARKHNEVGLTIGTPTNRNDRRRIYLVDSQRSILGLGGPGSGKSYSLVVPALLSALQQGMPTICYDFKYPSLSKIAAYAANCGYQIHILAPGYPESGTINPVELLRGPTDLETARQMVEVMHKNFRAGNSANSSENPFFEIGGRQATLGCLALAANTSYPDLLMAQIVLSLPKLAERLAVADHLSPWLLKGFDQLISAKGAEQTVAGLIANASELFNRLVTPNIIGTFLGPSTIPLDLHEKQLLIFGMDRERREIVAPIIAAIIQLLITRNVARPREAPLFVSLDELPTLVLPALAKMVNENRSDGLVVLAAAQNMNQLAKTYGQELSRVIFAGLGTKVFLNPQDSDSAEAFSKYLGDREITFKTRSRSYSRKSGNSRSINEHRQSKPLMSASDFLKLNTGECVLISPGLGYLPLKTKIQIPKRDDRIVALSKKMWPTIQQELAARSQSRPPTETDIRVRQEAAEKLLPLPPNSDDYAEQARSLLDREPIDSADS